MIMKLNAKSITLQDMYDSSIHFTMRIYKGYFYLGNGPLVNKVLAMGRIFFANSLKPDSSFIAIWCVQ